MHEGRCFAAFWALWNGGHFYVFNIFVVSVKNILYNWFEMFVCEISVAENDLRWMMFISECYFEGKASFIDSEFWVTATLLSVLDALMNPMEWQLFFLIFAHFLPLMLSLQMAHFFYPPLFPFLTIFSHFFCSLTETNPD